MKGKSGLAATAALAAAACMPMEQASLVYTSSNSIGVDVEAGTPQSPGLLVSIGYRGLNAAYVPVLAAKNCPEHDSENCTDPTYTPVELNGHSVQGDESSSTNDGEITRLAGDIQSRAGQIARLEEQTNQLGVRQAELERLTAQLRTLTPNEPQLPKADDQPDAEGGEIEGDVSDSAKVEQERIGREIAELEPTGGKSYTEQIATNRVTLEGLKQAQADDLGKLAAAYQIARNDTKNDAFSVFGSFDGNASGKAEGASLEVGQVFSTGIAAQFLTQGIGRASLLERRVQCINMLDKRFGTMPPKEFAALVADVCGEGDASAVPAIGN